MQVAGSQELRWCSENIQYQIANSGTNWALARAIGGDFFGLVVLSQVFRVGLMLRELLVLYSSCVDVIVANE